jgi:myo-inositol-1-phosphate synthase
VRTGVWLMGARGSVAVTSVVGATALRARLADPVGCVTEHPALRSEALPAFGELVFGGHDIVTTSIIKKAETLASAGVVPARLVASLHAELAAVEDDIRQLPQASAAGVDGAGTNTQAAIADAIAADVSSFRQRHQLDRVVLVNVASTEPAARHHPAHARLSDLRAALAAPESADHPVLPPSALAAYAAFQAGCSYMDFTPSTGARLPALHEFAVVAGVPYAGHDGKTGETLLKSVLAPMFAMRNLTVRSWSGINLLGGGDGATLSDPGANAAKAASKQRVLSETLGYTPDGQTRIEYVPDIGDFKTAWDLITFTGFLGTGMRMEFTWHGCDSALAAPLVLDLARLTAAAHRTGQVGPLGALAFFFKDPLAASDHGLAHQWGDLQRFVAELESRR